MVVLRLEKRYITPKDCSKFFSEASATGSLVKNLWFNVLYKRYLWYVILKCSADGVVHIGITASKWTLYGKSKKSKRQHHIQKKLWKSLLP